MSSTAYDWLTGPKADQRALYDAIKHSIDAHGLSWKDVFAQAFDGAQPGIGFEDNLRKGRVAGRRAGQLFRWLQARFPERAAELNWTLDGETAAAWETLIAEQAQADGVDLVRLPDAPSGIVSFANAERLALPSLRLGELFCFALSAPFDGTVLGLQAQRKRWYVLPLARHQPVAALRIGDQHLPFDAMIGAPIPLTENTVTGLCRFAFVLAGGAETDLLNMPTPLGTAVAPGALNALARQLIGKPRAAWRLLVLDVQFTD